MTDPISIYFRKLEPGVQREMFLERCSDEVKNVIRLREAIEMIPEEERTQAMRDTVSGRSGASPPANEDGGGTETEAAKRQRIGETGETPAAKRQKRCAEESRPPSPVSTPFETSTATAATDTSETEGPTPFSQAQNLVRAKNSVYMRELGAPATKSYGSIVNGAVPAEVTWLAKLKADMAQDQRVLVDMRYKYNNAEDSIDAAQAQVEENDLHLSELQQEHARYKALADRTEQAVNCQAAKLEASKVEHYTKMQESAHLYTQMQEKREEIREKEKAITALERPFANNVPISEVGRQLNVTKLSQLAPEDTAGTKKIIERAQAKGFSENNELIAKCERAQLVIDAVKRDPEYRVPKDIMEWMDLAGYESPDNMGEFSHWGYPFYRTFTTLRAVKIRLAFYLDLEIDCVLSKDGKKFARLPEYIQ